VSHIAPCDVEMMGINFVESTYLDYLWNVFPLCIFCQGCLEDKYLHWDIIERSRRINRTAIRKFRQFGYEWIPCVMDNKSRDYSVIIASGRFRVHIYKLWKRLGRVQVCHNLACIILILMTIIRVRHWLCFHRICKKRFLWNRRFFRWVR